MAKPMTAAEFLEDCDRIAHEVCAEEGIDYDEFMLNLAIATGCEVEYVK